MYGHVPALPQRNRQRSQWQVGALVAPLVLALIGAPALSGLRNECTLCPRTCPMHQHRESALPQEHSNCHVAVAQASPYQHGAAGERGAALSRAACGNRGGVPGTVLPPVLLTAAQRLPVAVAADAAPLADAVHCARVADPPDPPPPIHAA